ncbi:histone deacetylase [Leptospira gomenensis]|uniref:Histone deacetylase n=1 Tax=Leptospira gomenensis TaxID=2484974 RepID=A0A5F1YP31_9LEPT|nr:histone deacetylase [Leptospira gomenensis]TGK32698.1 histone deacetylase [Leptospira gomenensis]TGK36845.1 histone deacetylase [Leptospira gomenensis]TGK39921.1 histone deacetylase [Leptospira gomenensis]TGK58056.1 histone deacetylase [Leptospira gomenensis]
MSKSSYNNPRFFDFVYDEFLSAAVDDPSASFQEGILFHSLTKENILELLEITGILPEIVKKGYQNIHLEISGLGQDFQRLVLTSEKEILLHLRLSVQEYRLEINDYFFKEKYLIINWLQTRHPKSQSMDKSRLYPGQDVPGLGIFHQIADFIGFLILSLRLNGAVIRPEYFHDAVLFSKKFHFLTPEAQALFCALLRDFKHESIRGISTYLHSGKIKDHKTVIQWKAVEMILFLEKTLKPFVFNKKFDKKVNKLLDSMKLSLAES